MSKHDLERDHWEHSVHNEPKYTYKSKNTYMGANEHKWEQKFTYGSKSTHDHESTQG